MDANIIQDYEIISLIGEGGMGTVYLAEHKKLKRKAAIKFLNPEIAQNKEIKDRFHSEAITLAKLNQGNIVVIYDFLEIYNNLYIVMEYVEGKPLDNIITQTGCFEERRGIKIFEKILDGFAYAHNEGIIHRDIKPGNIILKYDDTPKILDFGIAKIVSSDIKLTKTGTRMGSVLYMSPEQILGKNVDIRSDIYSLGVTFYEMLAGKLPYNYNTESEFHIQTRIVQEPLKPLRLINPAITENTEKIILKATSKNRADRFNNCSEFNEALKSNTNFQYSYNPKSTIYTNTPGSFKNTVYQASESIPVKKSGNNLPIIILITAVIVLVISFLLYMLLNQNDKFEVPKVSNTESNTKKSTQTKQNTYYKLNGSYTGTIKDGTKWVLYIRDFDGTNFEGYNTTYWNSRGKDGLTAPIKGYLDKNNNKIIMDETSGGNKAGRFEGNIYEDGNKIEGIWTRYSDGGSFNWTLYKDN